MMGQLELLLELQEIDLAMADLQEEIECDLLQENVRAAVEKLDELRADLDRQGGRQAEQRKQLRSMEMDLNKIVSDRKGLHQKLYGGEVSNVRELENMEKRLESLKVEQENLEEDIFRLMEQAEDQQEKIAGLKEEAARQEQEVQGEQNRLQQKLNGLDLQLKQLQENRDKLLPRVESKYRDLYLTQCRRHKGKGISRVINDTCESCRVYISLAQRGLLYNPSSIVYCENCGRLLVRSPEPEGGNNTTDTQGGGSRGGQKKGSKKQ